MISDDFLCQMNCYSRRLTLVESSSSSSSSPSLPPLDCPFQRETSAAVNFVVGTAAGIVAGLGNAEARPPPSHVRVCDAWPNLEVRKSNSS